MIHKNQMSVLTIDILIDPGTVYWGNPWAWPAYTVRKYIFWRQDMVFSSTVTSPDCNYLPANFCLAFYSLVAASVMEIVWSRYSWPLANLKTDSFCICFKISESQNPPDYSYVLWAFVTSQLAKLLNRMKANSFLRCFQSSISGAQTILGLGYYVRKTFSINIWVEILFSNV